MDPGGKGEDKNKEIKMVQYSQIKKEIKGNKTTTKKDRYRNADVFYFHFVRTGYKDSSPGKEISYDVT